MANTKQSGKDSFLLFHEVRLFFEELTAEEQGRLFMALLDYSEFGREPEFTGMLRMAFRAIQRSMDRNTEKWEQTCAKRSEAGKKSAAAKAAKNFAETVSCKNENQETDRSKTQQTATNSTEYEPEPDPDPEPEPDIPETHPVSRFFSLPQLPGTGFSAGHPAPLSELPKDLRYEPSGLTLQIPSLDVSEKIVMIPFRDGEYPVEWLGSSIGLPEEFSLPGTGPCILAAHNHLNMTEAGPFALLSMLSENAKLIITGNSGEMLTFTVFANVKIAADDMAAVRRLSDSGANSLVLITCEDEKPEGGYATRRVVAAKPAF